MSTITVVRKYEVEIDDNHLTSIEELGLPQGELLYEATRAIDSGILEGWLYCVTQNTGDRNPDNGSFLWVTKWGTLEDFTGTQFRSLYGPVHFSVREVWHGVGDD